MLRVVLAASTALALGGCTVGPNFQAPSWASPASWFAGPREQVPPDHSRAGRRTGRSQLVDPVPRRRADRAGTPRRRRRTWTCASPPSGWPNRAPSSAWPARRSSRPSTPTRSYTRQKASNVGQFAAAPNPLGANGASGNTAGGLRSANLRAVQRLSGRLRRLLGARSVGRREALGRIRHRLGRRPPAEARPRRPALQPGRGGARLHRPARRADAVAHRPRQRAHRASKACN